MSDIELTLPLGLDELSSASTKVRTGGPQHSFEAGNAVQFLLDIQDLAGASAKVNGVPVPIIERDGSLGTREPAASGESPLVHDSGPRPLISLFAAAPPNGDLRDAALTAWPPPCDRQKTECDSERDAHGSGNGRRERS